MLDTAHQFLNRRPPALIGENVGERMTMKLRRDESESYLRRGRFSRIEIPSWATFRNRIVAAMPACSKQAAMAFRFVESGGGKSDEGGSQSAQYQSKRARNFPHGKHCSVPPWERHEEQLQGAVN